MPAIDDVNKWDSAEMRKLADAEIGSRLAEIGKRRGYYEGMFPPPLVDTHDNVVINLCRQVIDETAAFLSPNMPSLELDSDGGVTNSDEAMLSNVWMDSGGARLVNQMAVGGGIAGHVFVRVVVQPDGRVRVINLNAQHVIRWWLASDHLITMGYEIRWRNGTTEYRTDVIRVEGQWVVRDMYRDHPKGVGGIVVTNPAWIGEVESVWAYPIAPIVDWQHLPNIGGAYGMDEIPHANMNLHINKIASDIKSILRYHAYPTTVGTGFSAKDVQETRINGFLTVPNADAKVYNVEMQSDLASSMMMLDTMRDSFFNLARVVVVKGGLDTFRGMTNLGIRAAFMPMIAKTAQLRRNYEEGMVALSRLILMIKGVDAEDMPITVVWGEALPMDQAEELRLIEKQMVLGLMSQETAAGRMGLNYDKEMANKRREAIIENEMINGIGDNVG